MQVVQVHSCQADRRFEVLAEALGRGSVAPSHRLRCGNAEPLPRFFHLRLPLRSRAPFEPHEPGGVVPAVGECGLRGRQGFRVAPRFALQLRYEFGQFFSSAGERLSPELGRRPSYAHPAEFVHAVFRQ
ncbi:hypothetical protein C1280_14550 [Gemmata obscuriglobus]|uniref:Uncharacterized protein n=1 Tax=Gemmata obscuriglobus TaxID=114 RepID=A0A2Z3HAD3_9BACT|nr:hypothetical protein C1280_14550 [Gemmata obscuriglobus]